MAPRKKVTTVTEIIPETTESQSQTDNGVLGISDFTVVLTKVHRLVNGKRAFAFQTESEVDEVVIQDRYPQGGTFGVERFNDMGQSIERVVMDIDPKPMGLNPPTTNGSPSSVHDLQIQLLMNELSWMRQTMTNMITNRSGNETSIGEMVTALQGLNGLVGGKDPMDLVMKGMDLAAKFAKTGGEVDWKSQLIDAFKETAGPAIQAFTMMNRQNGNANANEGEQMRIVQTPESQLKDGITWLKKKILAGLTPDLAVEWLVQNANDPQYQPIISTAINGGVDAFIQLDAEIGNEPYKTWFTTAIEDLKGLYAEQSTNATDNDGGNGNGADVTTNAKSRSPKSQKPKAV